MTLRSRRGPENGHQLVHSALAARTRRTTILNLLGGGDARTMDPIPVYLLGLDEARRTDPLERVVQTGWRYLVVSNGTASVAHLKAEKDLARYSGLSHGPVSNKLLHACELAEKEIGAQDIVYEPRIIDAPALHFSALWLHGPSEPYVSLLEGGDNLSLGRDLRARIRSAVEEWSKHAPTAGGAKSETPWNY